MTRLLLPTFLFPALLTGCDLLDKPGRDVEDTGRGNLDADADTDADADADADADTDCQTWYGDGDRDGFGSDDDTQVSCERPQGYVGDGGDCDDGEDTVYPGADELCDELDNDCDGDIDDDASATWYRDSDGDGVGDSDSTRESCDSPGAGWVLEGGDCDDDNENVTGASEELCDGVDNDCNGLVDDDAVDGVEFPADADGDGFGDPYNTEIACDPPSGNTVDCDDSDPHEPQVVDQSIAAAVPAGTRAAPWRLIQEGIDNATLCVAVFPGTYVENVDFSGKDIEVFSITGAADTSIDGGGLGPAVTFVTDESAGAELRGFTITGGSGFAETTSSSSSCGSGTACTTTYIRNYGGGIFVDGASPTLTGLWVLYNQLPDYSFSDGTYDDVYVMSYGGGIFVNNAIGMTMSDVRIDNNVADTGGGLYIGDAASVTLSRVAINYNEGTHGGGLSVAGTLDAANLVLASNRANVEGGALYVAGTAEVVNATIVGNRGDAGGGVAVLDGGTLTLMNSAVTDGPEGFGVFVEAGSTFSGSYNNVHRNRGGEYSGVTDPTGTLGNLSVEPGYMAWSDDSTDNDDLHLESSSAMYDAGNSARAYNDGGDDSRNDIGAYGGPNGGW